MKPIPCRLPEVRELLDLLPGQRAAAPLALPKPGVKMVSRGCVGPGGAQRGCTGSALRGFAGWVILQWGDFSGRREAGQGRTLLCWSSGVWGQGEGAGQRVEKAWDISGFRAGCACPRGRAGGISQLRCPGRASLHRQSSAAASEPRADSWGTWQRAATADAATRCKCH